MTKYPTQIHLYDHVPNSNIVHVPGHRLPAIAIPGHTVSRMLIHALEVMANAKDAEDHDLYDESLLLAQKLRQYLIQYEETLEAEGMERPYWYIAENVTVFDECDN